MSFYTLNKPSEGLFRDRGSKFHSFAYPVFNEEEINAHLSELRKNYHDARHHCYAWRLGKNGDHFRANDDGEPSNSAGMPILGQLRAHDLTHTLIVVVRYFGGTLLGVGGLINAYRTAARDAIENSMIVNRKIFAEYLIDFEYPEMNNVMKVLKDMDLEQKDQQFELKCSLTARVALPDKEKFEKAFEVFPEIKLTLTKEESY